MPLVDTPMDESTPWLVKALQERCPASEGGLLRDGAAGNEAVWCGPLPAFESWYAELESTLDQTLGRRLAHAAAESEEQRWSRADPLPRAWFKQQAKRVAVVNSDWDQRGLGQLGLLEEDEGTLTLLVANRAQTAIAAGMANAAWECIREQRYRFQWSDRGAGETLVELTPDPRSIPAPSVVVVDWTDHVGEMMEDERYFDRARHEADGLWTVEGQRTFLLTRDLLLRFESLVLPHLASTERSTDSRTEWCGIEDADKLIFWDGAAEASRRQFLAGGQLVLIANADHWLGVGRQYLAREGLGRVTEAAEVDGHGGVRLRLAAAFHPALVVGRLLGCWERAEGRPGRATWTTDARGHEIILQSRREIAE